MKPIIKTPEQIKTMRKAGKILAETLEHVCNFAKPGVSTFDLDKIAEEYILSKKAIPGFKGFNGFPATLCTSINQVIVHGIPKKNDILKDGDLIKIDCGVILDGLFVDAARAIGIGNISDLRKRLIKTAKLAFQKGISKAIHGNKCSEIGKAIEEVVNKEGFKIIFDLTGHGVGKKLHEPPVVFNYFNKKEDIILKEGMTLAIEPIFSVSTHRMKTEKDNWTISTIDQSDAVQYEETILIGKSAPEILTKVD